MVEKLPPLRSCPRCRITMQAGRSNPLLPDYDTFTCLNCDLVMSFNAKGDAANVPIKAETPEQG